MAAEHMALLANCHRASKRAHWWVPADFNPYERKPRTGIPITAENIEILKTVFVNGKEP
jgi:hypothetical protein